MSQANQLTDVSVVPEEDREILNHQLNGVESEKEAADVLVSKMLDEERAAGRGKEAHEGEEGTEVVDPAEEEADKVKAKQIDESESQRRRRLRRESENRTRAERDRLNQEVGRLKERLKQVEEKNPERNRDQYADNQEAYIGDRAGYAAQHVATVQSIEEAERAAEEADERLSSHQQEAITEYFAEGNKKYPDFERTVKAEGLAITNAMAEVFLDEGMQDIAYELAKQPHELARIAAIPSPIMQVKEILKAQAALEAKASERVTTKAPPPIKPIRAAGAPQAKSLSEMSFAEYEAYRKKQMATRR